MGSASPQMKKPKTRSGLKITLPRVYCNCLPSEPNEDSAKPWRATQMGYQERGTSVSTPSFCNIMWCRHNSCCTPDFEPSHVYAADTTARLIFCRANKDGLQTGSPFWRWWFQYHTHSQRTDRRAFGPNRRCYHGGGQGTRAQDTIELLAVFGKFHRLG